MPNLVHSDDQNASANADSPRAVLQPPQTDSLDRWAEAYLHHQVTTSESSQREQRRDIGIFLRFVALEVSNQQRPCWTPRVSRAFVDHLRDLVTSSGQRRYSDRTLNRFFATLRPWARWIHKLAPFPLGDPMSEIKNLSTTPLDIERALTKRQRRALLDAADVLPVRAGRSKDRRRHRGAPPEQRPRHRFSRPWRDRAIIYTLIETGMRRAAVTAIDLPDVDFEAGTVTTLEKGGHRHIYTISQQGLDAIDDYVEHERDDDNQTGLSPILFLPAREIRSNRTGRLSPRSISTVWSKRCEAAGVAGCGCHAARHAVGLHIIEKTGNPAAVQRQLGHRHPSTSLLYCRIRAEDLRALMDER